MKAKESYSFASSPTLLLSSLLLLAFIAYHSILNSYFLSDDFVQIGKALEGDWSVAWGREHGGFFRPLFIVSYIIESRAWGVRPLGYHLTNVLLHGLNSYLVYNLALSLLRPLKLNEDCARRLSLAAALLFLLHPSHTEAVSWISGRADLLATLFCLASILAYIFYLEKLRAVYLLLSLLSLALALLSKESAITLPFILLGVGIYFAATGERRKAAFAGGLKRVALFLPVLLLFVIVRRAVLGAWIGGYGAGQHLNFSPGWIRDRFLQAVVRSVLPVFPPGISAALLKPLKSPAFILIALASVCLIVLLLRRRRQAVDSRARGEQNRLALLLLAGFLLSLLPVINLRMSPFDTQGERFIYWPSAFASMLIPYLGFILLRERWLRLLLLLCLLVFYSVSLYRTNQTWREAAGVSRAVSEELVRAASNQQRLLVINAPDNLRGVPLFHNGLDEAVRVFQKDVRIERVSVLSLHSIQSLNDGAELKMEGETFTLRLTNRADAFTKIADGPDCAEILEQSNDTLRFRTAGCKDGIALFFDAGKMYRVIGGANDGVAP